MSGNSVKKGKRSRSKANETNKSIVEKVTSKVTGMLSSTIVKWFKSPSSSSKDSPRSNGSVVIGDATDSSTEDETQEIPSPVFHPPAKRMRLNSSTQYQQFSINDTSVNNIEALEPITPYNNMQSTLRDSSFFDLHIPKPDVPQEKVEKVSNNAFKPQHNISSASVGAIISKRKSLFDTPSSSEMKIRRTENAANISIDSTLPTFKPCLLGSPFYSGRTMYGGAAASYINQSNVQEQKPTVVNETSNRDNTMSQSAIRVMHLLEQYSSPLYEAKRIPIISTSRNREDILNRLENLTSQSSRSSSYKMRELNVPGFASILRLKQRARHLNTTSVARQIHASHSSTSDQPYVSISNQNRLSPSKELPASSQNYTTKIKSRVTRTKRGDEFEKITIEPVNLPSATLQIDQSKLQNFSFGISMASSPIPTAPITPKNMPSNPYIIGSTPQTETTSEITPYQFSNPAKVSPDSKVGNIKSPDMDNRPNFTFVSPEKSSGVTSNKNEQITNTMVTENKKNEVASSKSKEWKCGDCWVTNKADIEKCVCCGGKKPTNEKVSEKQVSDKCMEFKKITLVKINSPVIKENNVSKWTCDDCWVSNGDTAEKCLCCGAAKPKKALKVAASLTIAPTTNEWTCDICLIKNLMSVEKCAACGNNKPSPKQAAPAISNSAIATETTDNEFKGLLKSQSNKWECPNCLVGNDTEKLKCVCCDTAKPGTKKEPDNVKFNFDMNTNVTFKFGIDPKLQLNNNFSNSVENKSFVIPPKEGESEKNNNVLPKTSSFTFGLPIHTKQDQIKSVNTFTFGQPTCLSSDSTPALPTFTFANNVSKPESNKTSDTERLQEVPKINFAAPISSSNTKNEDIQKTPMLFSMPVKTSQIKEKSVPPVLFGSPITSDKTDSPAITATPVSNAAKPVSTFTFSGSSPQATPLFGSAAPPSLFADKPAAPAQSQETPSTTAGAPTAANASMFTFGSTADKPKFNFTFSAQSNSEKPTPLFGNAKPDATVPLFGNTKIDPPAPLFAKSDPQPSLFGHTKTDATSAPLFGTTTDAPAPLFGSAKTETHVNLFANMKPETGKLFGNAGKSDAPLFGAATKAETPIFGSTTKTNPPLFGSNTNTAEPAPLFGNTPKPDAPLFGNTPQPDSGLFGNTNKVEPSMFKFGGATETSTGGNKFGSNMFGATQNDATSFGSPPSASGMFSTQKPASFSFGSTPVFSATSPTFGASEPAPIFGAATAPTPTKNIFGASAASVPSTGMFGSPTATGATNFGTPNVPIPPYEASTLTPPAAPAFNFGATQNTGVFGFGQQAQPAAQGATGAAVPPGGGGVYTFGGGAGGAGAANLQFSMGAGAPPTGPGGASGPPRRVRKVARRNLPR